MVVTIPDEERQEVIDAVNLVAEILLVAWLITLFILYIFVGIILQPINNLIKTAEGINEQQLSYRMIIQGKGQMAKLAYSFNLMMERLDKAFKTQNKLLNDVSHELRTPITIIRGHLELLDYNSELEREKTIPLVLDELDRMSRLVEELLLLAKVDQENFLRLERVDLREFIMVIYQKVQVLAERNWQLVNNETITLTLDSQKISQALINLIQNAIQHTQPGDKITVIAKIGQKKVYLGIQDTGVGIHKSEQDKIFKQFFRASNSRSDKTKGAGLGLAIVKAIAEKHNGSVQVYSRLGKGSLFYLILPIK